MYKYVHNTVYKFNIKIQTTSWTQISITKNIENINLKNLSSTMDTMEIS